ncbi:hypothetical protein J2T13_001801 [Paenibacillus sp. DS2015]|uniref:hypothetical protein n=1 Tax=Paenibacillus sp. DS2015 TaxID=3373917 RepID=UPI003D201956
MRNEVLAPIQFLQQGNKIHLGTLLGCTSEKLSMIFKEFQVFEIRSMQIVVL